MIKRIALIALALFLLVGSNTFISFLIDLWWFEAIGKSDVFWHILYTKTIIFFTIFLLFSGMLVFNVYLAFRFTKGQQIRSIEGSEFLPEKILKTLTFFATILISLLGAFTAASWWEEILYFLNASDFNINDPIFQLILDSIFFSSPFIKFCGLGIDRIDPCHHLQPVHIFSERYSAVHKKLGNPFFKQCQISS